MKMKEIELKLIDNKIPELPFFTTEGSAGVDLVAAIDRVIQIPPEEVIKIKTGIAISIEDPSIMGMIVPRSGLGSRGLILANGTGIIDSDYQGEILLPLWNRSRYEAIPIKPYDRVAQLIFINIHTDICWNLVTEFSTNTGRGAGGFGSTGPN
jgi:dUTP pyrophosphatase